MTILTCDCGYEIYIMDETEATAWQCDRCGQWYDFFVNLGGLPDWGSASVSGDDYYWSGQSELVSKVNAYFSPLGDGNYDAFMPNNSYQTFWSSSEYSGYNARLCRVNSIGNVLFSFYGKGNGSNVRPVLAF